MALFSTILYLYARSINLYPPVLLQFQQLSRHQVYLWTESVPWSVFGGGFFGCAQFGPNSASIETGGTLLLTWAQS